MPHYFFDFLDEGGLALDEEGLELSDLCAARAEAARSLADMALDAIRSPASVNDRHTMAIEVRDASGPVIQVTFSLEIVTLRH